MPLWRLRPCAVLFQKAREFAFFLKCLGFFKVQTSLIPPTSPKPERGRMHTTTGLDGLGHPSLPLLSIDRFIGLALVPLLGDSL